MRIVSWRHPIAAPFTAPVDGDCQHPKWKDGEIVVFSFDAVEREGILDGRSYYLAFTDGSTTFKRVSARTNTIRKFLFFDSGTQKKKPGTRRCTGMRSSESPARFRSR